MGAEVHLNGQYLGTVADQFLRYNFSVQSLLKPTGNVLNVIFPAHYGINTGGRFMACTGGWDWYVFFSHVTSYLVKLKQGTLLTNKCFRSSYFFTRYLEIRILSLHRYRCDYTCGALGILHWLVSYCSAFRFESCAFPGIIYLVRVSTKQIIIAPKQVTVAVHFYAPTAITGALKVAGEWGYTNVSSISLPAGESVFTLTLTASNVDLWWPAGNILSLFDVIT